MTIETEQSLNQNKVIDLEAKIEERKQAETEEWDFDKDVEFICPRRERLIKLGRIKPTDEEREILELEKRWSGGNYLKMLLCNTEENNIISDSIETPKEVRHYNTPDVERLRESLEKVQTKSLSPDEEAAFEYWESL